MKIVSVVRKAILKEIDEEYDDMLFGCQGHRGNELRK
jgi:hypothetical protein